MLDERSEAVEIPEPVQPPQLVTPSPVEVKPEEEEEESVEDLSDLTRVTKEDVLGRKDGNSEPDDMSDLTGLDEEDEADLLEVTDEDIMGEAPEKPVRKVYPVRRFRRTPYRYPPPTTIGGIR